MVTVRAMTLLRLARQVAMPEVCPCCLARQPLGDPDCSGLCSECRAQCGEFTGRRCSGCGGALDGVLATCSDCLQAPERPWQNAVSVFPFGGKVRELVHRFKYRRHTYLARFFAERMLLNWDRHGGGAPDVVTPVPLHWFKQVCRGYNQAELLAEQISNALRVPCVSPVRRSRWTAQQAMLDFGARQDNMKNAFVLTEPQGLSGRHVLVVDDVMTTGATVADFTRTLLSAEPNAVSVLTAARG
ncbi:MAG: ComF family protein [Lentisphaerae bacterium]|nr:ComF family protein [Lentisphaerota bacterium]MBT4819420.1 ComF family protein [Lentisphaerota bacterium]MBT5605183.1 ComF family protein [Lentisphaerota bacterium]MBT7054365.1 ComF family protein [Lentisphaerota bacterium]MBT7844851.1 ComF family protein [Lentisphaerota bacterium]